MARHDWSEDESFIERLGRTRRYVRDEWDELDDLDALAWTWVNAGASVFAESRIRWLEHRQVAEADEKRRMRPPRRFGETERFHVAMEQASERERADRAAGRPTELELLIAWIKAGRPAPGPYPGYGEVA